MWPRQAWESCLSRWNLYLAWRIQDEGQNVAQIRSRNFFGYAHFDFAGFLDEPSPTIRWLYCINWGRMPMELLCTSSWACDRLLSDDEGSCEVHVQKSPFTTVLGVRQGRSDKKVFLPRCPPNLSDVEERKISFLAAIFSSLAQQLSTAVLCSDHSLLSSHNHPPSLETLSYHFAVVSVAIEEKENQAGNNNRGLWCFVACTTLQTLRHKPTSFEKNPNPKPVKPEQKFLGKSSKRVLESWTKGGRQLMVEKTKRVVKKFVGTCFADVLARNLIRKCQKNGPFHCSDLLGNSLGGGGEAS